MYVKYEHGDMLIVFVMTYISMLAMSSYTELNNLVLAKEKKKHSPI